eukprot:507177-Hanusia_phi.AAC.4
MSEELKSRFLRTGLIQLQKAKTLAREATEADQRGDHSNAVEKYSEAVCPIATKRRCTKSSSNTSMTCCLVRRASSIKLTSVIRDRAAVLESKTFINALPDIPTDLDTPSDPLSKHVQKNEGVAHGSTLRDLLPSRWFAADASEAGIKDWEPSSTLPVVKAAGKVGIFTMSLRIS